ncbi:MAG: hypothetical protein QF803_10975 [Gammaproteobacteria bacterium]|jgi:hypothetical protein|nr:hypothetical protein [Gammaproteobacteria bacterium]MDP6696120.1 hypothetical protein [Gammaproteobacteria bacterium]
MKKLFLILMLALPGITFAAPVTVDFEEFSVGTSPVGLGNPLQSKGYDFVGTVILSNMSILIGNSGSKSWGGTASGAGQDSFGVTARIEMERTDGGAFAILSADIFQVSDPAGFTSISGSTTSGVANLAVPIGTGDWLDLTRIVFHSEGNGFGFGSATTELDNIVVRAVPIPAAVWLFGSGLGLLGWIKRREVFAK